MNKHYLICFITGEFVKKQWSWKNNDFHMIAKNEELAVQKLHDTIGNYQTPYKKLLVMKVEQVNSEIQ